MTIKEHWDNAKSVVMWFLIIALSLHASRPCYSKSSDTSKRPKIDLSDIPNANPIEELKYELKSQIKSLSSDIFSLELKFDELEDAIDDIDGRLHALEARLDKILE